MAGAGLTGTSADDPRTRAAVRRALTPLLLLAGAALFVAVPGIPATCPVRVLFHVPCPSCGLTRAARLALGGHLGDATQMHPLWFLVLPFLLGVGAAESASFVRSGAWGRVTGTPGVRWTGLALLVALVAVWGARWAGAFGGPVPVD